MSENAVNAAGSLVYVSIACTLVSLLLRNGAFGRAMRYVCGLCVLITVIGVFSPLLKSISDITITLPKGDDVDTDTESPIDGVMTAESARYVCGYVKTAISQRFGIEGEAISVSVTLDTEGDEGVMIKSVTVTLPKENEAVFSSVAEYVSGLVGSGCIVIPRE